MSTYDSITNEFILYKSRLNNLFINDLFFLIKKVRFLLKKCITILM